MNDIKIYTCHHKPSSFLSAATIHPLHVGKANSLNDIGCPGDDTGDNISFKNPFYCELTAHYWVWKNEHLADYVGFMHYRRHLNFSPKQDYPEDVWGVVNSPVIDAAYEAKFGLSDEVISESIRGYDLVVPRKWSVTSAGSKNNFEHYEKGEFLHIGDYQAAIEVVTELYPDYASAIKTFNTAADGYYTNMFVMKKNMFTAYSEWLFSILSVLEHRISMNNYNAQEKRVIGHIAERLFNIYLIKQQEEKQLKIKELQRTFVTEETFNGKLKPAFSENAAPIVISFDDNYAISGGALINSIVRHAEPTKNYDIVVLENRVSALNKKRLMLLVHGFSNISLRFFDVNAFSEMNGVHTRAHFSASTYARLFIPLLFRDFPKVIFIDSDTVVKTDLAQLMEIELGNNLVGAVKDIVMEGFVKFGAMSESDDGVMPAEQYLKSTLNMDDPDAYFQAGIIIFNIAKMVEENTFSRLMETMKAKKYWFLDQDIMNKVFYDRVVFLPPEWNVYHGNGNTDDFFPNLKFATYMRFLQARRSPNMIHYAGENKPWNTDKVDFFDDFMENITGTPWERIVYGRILTEQLGITSDRATRPVKNRVLLQTRIKNQLRLLVNKYAPVGTSRRNLITKCYYKVRRAISG
ncbi:DUF4422 domain-containing protein [Shimwellia blattae]|uniref:Putative lipopolysaccharide biosynthesis glycosyltransferase n=1 Tax=Shimwellia blattae (strain ATCC 29907 / DSM 4481 / JCM 1650 / NBRC 105725 / CDC 9005-74) TaxID=630626 RepID=I2B7P7_SHIBC|nr:DUF4422 domain-containing protein [Shimwellia blattae]AFJ46551.1 putative lipopolysaccharide biosynthesis glycosyltransferase [Shimwellia blattae DSM 4481 = NBRC 105725]GAB80130.1 putative glycosyltransferase [Shimwellia blattae DSM 4481 = NBRC 105725]VDY64019.1 General stress protein A [Shimwellia blattae]VEC22154.1 General stress protein A [Shimwellia blattae]